MGGSCHYVSRDILQVTHVSNVEGTCDKCFLMKLAASYSDGILRKAMVGTTSYLIMEIFCGDGISKGQCSSHPFSKTEQSINTHLWDPEQHACNQIKHDTVLSANPCARTKHVKIQMKVWVWLACRGRSNCAWKDLRRGHNHVLLLKHIMRNKCPHHNASRSWVCAQKMLR